MCNSPDLRGSLKSLFWGNEEQKISIPEGDLAPICLKVSPNSAVGFCCGVLCLFICWVFLTLLMTALESGLTQDITEHQTSEKFKQKYFKSEWPDFILPMAPLQFSKHFIFILSLF